MKVYIQSKVKFVCVETKTVQKRGREETFDRGNGLVMRVVKSTLGPLRGSTTRCETLTSPLTPQLFLSLVHLKQFLPYLSFLLLHLCLFPRLVPRAPSPPPRIIHLSFVDLTCAHHFLCLSRGWLRREVAAILHT